MTGILVNFDPANAQRLCWNLNALLENIGGGNRFEITLSWMVKPVTGVVRRPLLKAARCCRFVPDSPRRLSKIPAHPNAHHEIATEAPALDGRLPDKAAGRKIVPLP
jgi:hypothetical protein